MKLYCSYESDTWITDTADPKDKWSRDSTQGTYAVNGVHLTGGFRDQVHCEDEVNEGDTVYVAYVSYSTGDTFGTDGGYGSPVLASKDEEIAHWALDWARDPEQRGGEWPVEGGKPAFKSWHGYFEHNQAYRVAKCIVER